MVHCRNKLYGVVKSRRELYIVLQSGTVLYRNIRNST